MVYSDDKVDGEEEEEEEESAQTSTSSSYDIVLNIVWYDTISFIFLVSAQQNHNQSKPSH